MIWRLLIKLSQLVNLIKMSAVGKLHHFFSVRFLIFFTIFLTFLIFTYFTLLSNSSQSSFSIRPQNNYFKYNEKRTIGLKSESYRLSQFDIPQFNRDEFETLCLKNSEEKTSRRRSINFVYETIVQLKLSSHSKCQEVLHAFNSILTIEKIDGVLKLPDAFTPQVKSWLGNNEALFSKIFNQQIYKVVSLVSGDESVYNLLRSKRPVSKSGIDPIVYINDLVNSTISTCDFCNYSHHTAYDSFGRIESKYSASASNTFKLAKFHALFFPYSHHPLNLSGEELADLFLVTSQKWFKKVNEVDPSQRYGSILWDSLPHAGASQVHPHIHGLSSSSSYSGQFSHLHQSAISHFSNFSRNLWTDFILAHKVLGLTIEHGNAVALVPITSRKDHEIWILSPELNMDFIKLLVRVLNAYKKNLGIFCHSAGGSYPVLGGDLNTNDDEITKNSLPLILKIGSRGDCTTMRSDVSSLELYTVNNINSDLEETISALEKN